MPAMLLPLLKFVLNPLSEMLMRFVRFIGFALAHPIRGLLRMMVFLSGVIAIMTLLVLIVEAVDILSSPSANWAMRDWLIFVVFTVSSAVSGLCRCDEVAWRQKPCENNWELTRPSAGSKWKPDSMGM